MCIRDRAQVVQLAVVIQHVLLVLGGDGDLVGNAPADDAGVVVVLDLSLIHIFPANSWEAR